MTNWLARAKLEISKSVSEDTANSAERDLLSVMAVPLPGKSEISPFSIGSNDSTADTYFDVLTKETKVDVLPVLSPKTLAEQKAKVLEWLAYIQETDPAIIELVLRQCEIDNDARLFFIREAEKTFPSITFNDDRRSCNQCANLTPGGLCLADWGSEKEARRRYKPVRDIPRRCECYLPKSFDIDQRSGLERWPGLMQKTDGNPEDI